MRMLRVGDQARSIVQRAHSFFATGLMLLSTILLGSCAGSGPMPVTINFPGGTAVAIDNDQKLIINVTTTNDSGAGVTWSCSGTACPNPLGSPAWVTTTTSVMITVSAVGTAMITATSIKQTSMSKTVVLTVNAVLALPSTAAIQALLTADPGTVGDAYSFAFTATGGTAPLTWTWSLTPTSSDGLSIAAGGAVSGTPGSANTLTFTVTVTDSSAADASQTSTSLNLLIIPVENLTSISVCLAPNPTPPCNLPTIAPQGQPVNYTAIGTYSNGTTSAIPVTWSSGNAATAYMNQAGIAVTLAPGNTSVIATSGTIMGSATLNVVAPVSRFAYLGSSFNDNISAYAVNSNSKETEFIPRGYNLAEDTNFPNGFSVQGMVPEPTGRFVYIFNGSTNQVDQFNIQAGGGMTSSGNAAVPQLGFPGVPYCGVADPTGRYLYLSIANLGLMAYSIDQTSGAITALNGGTPYLATQPPGGLITDRTGQFLYGSSDGIYAFSINSDGTLTALNNSAPYALTAGESDGTMAVDPLNQNIYVATNENSVSVWPITSGGALGAGVSFSVPAGLTTQALAIGPSGTRLYLLDLPPSITGYPTVDLALLPLTASPISLTTGPSLSPGMAGATDESIPVTPTGMIIDPGGNFIVVNNAEPDIAFLLSIAPSTGVLTFEPPVPTFTDAISLILSTGAKAPAVSASSVFAANQVAPGTISTYTISDGALDFASAVPGIGGNSLLAADPFGRYLYSLSPSLDELYSYSMAASSGALTALTNPVSSLTTSPTSVVADPSGQYVYVAAGGQYYGYSYSSSAKSLQPISGSPFGGSASPTILATDQAGLFLFGLGSSGIDTMVINSEGEVPGPRLGQLTHKATYSVSGQFVAAAVDSSGQFLFALDNLNEQIDVFYIYTDQFRDGFGSITELSPTSTGSSTMSSLAVDPLGRFIVVGDQSGGITTYSFNLSTNVLTQAQTVFPNGPGEIPMSQVVIDPTGSNLFAVQVGYPGKNPPLEGRVLIYSIGPTGTVTPTGIPPEPPSAGAGIGTNGLALGITIQ